MPVVAFRAWDHAGRPITPAQPIRELVAGLKSKFPRAAAQFGWYANNAHYEAVPAGDHTPYSSDAWPLTPNPQWVVFATDVMHHPELGVDCRILGPYWLAEAKAGRMPWLKYLIWDGHIYDVRHKWARQTADDHYDHVHLSARTDAQHASLGSWSITPPPASTPTTEDDMGLTPAEAQQAQVDAWRLDALQTGSTTVRGGPVKGETMWAVVAIKDNAAKVDALTGSVAALATAVGQIGTHSPEVADLVAQIHSLLNAATAAIGDATRNAVANLGEGGAQAVRTNHYPTNDGGPVA